MCKFLALLSILLTGILLQSYAKLILMCQDCLWRLLMQHSLHVIQLITSKEGSLV